jgi:hypothetical protein
VLHRVFLCLKIKSSLLKSLVYQTIQYELAVQPPQNKQNLVNYHPLLRLFAMQQLSVYFQGRFLDLGFSCELLACGQDHSG